VDADRVVREQLLFLLLGGNAHMTFDQAVADFPMERINSLPPNVSYTPWHLLEHIRIAQWDILEFSRDPDHVSPRWPEGYWPPPDEQADEVKWEKTISDIRADLRALQDMVEDSGTDLYVPLRHAPGYTMLREIMLVADHNAYHIGEFAVLRQTMDTWRA
jgi:hypothetical protein